ncbi:putative epimerase/dehydratase family protein [Aspergillus nomiae NRRL 13137]|uniref:Fatty acyl-CoA reductase n=1 Tax=Aspergillus nomiae NRRL (strain ATCC 15546 / NRRL 13137 / CBS 260.88 / M93) TaxID=1509407 RepID=A0A0L1JD24_ASPN3|nr:putative epimerase/dehydratase family protein [Aspergillus nomiae NRRL 13137]KNG89318.1 putative epimerase/dehydratase family protein [Aspergillus nomiae NRRL 13137]
MWDYYSEKSILITGASGFLGTAITHRLASKACPKRMYILCRGGKSQLIKKWRRNLPKDFDWLLNLESITVLDGDIMKAGLGLPREIISELQKEVNIIIHAASTINLTYSLERVFEHIVIPSESLAQMALDFTNLDRFVYVSTAFANTHLYKVSNKAETVINEDIYPLLGEGKLLDDSLLSAQDARDQIKKTGFSAEFELHDFPWPYAYGKHLAERLILNLFIDKGWASKVLIIRPSVIGPAERYPYPGYSVPFSTPSTALAAAIIASPVFSVTVPTRCSRPAIEATIDEVPVDVVVDRMVAHVALNTTGCVQAVGGERGRVTFEDFWGAAMKLRRLPWEPRIVWSSTVDWHSPDLHPVLRLYVILGTAFLFREEKTDKLWERLSSDEREDVILFRNTAGKSYELISRREHIRLLLRLFARRTIFPAWLLVYLCR